MNIPTQIVDENSLQVSSWSHQISKSGDLLKRIFDNSHIYCSEKILDGNRYVTNMCMDDKMYYLYSSNTCNNPIEYVTNMLNSIITMYTNNSSFKRLKKEEYNPTFSSITFEFPIFSIQEILKIISNKDLFLQNVVRFVIACGKLRDLKIPINIIRSPEVFEFDWKELLKIN
ncbi:hypothetical protein [Bacillus sp. 166amftsu]|uniref:hypothetical protein n=1 Tax=Bacillus sp. 166amftsu TaxID=1761753 RepID=UPI000B82E975|nr:hypothetical protein [Bacillus sp. 166amftsu]